VAAKTPATAVEAKNQEPRCQDPKKEYKIEKINKEK